MVWEKEEVQIIEKLLIHEDADSHGINEPLRKIITYLLNKF